MKETIIFVLCALMLALAVLSFICAIYGLCLSNVADIANIGMLALAIITIIFTYKEWKKREQDRFIKKIDYHIEQAHYNKKCKPEHCSKIEKTIEELTQLKYNTFFEEEFNHKEAEKKLQEIIVRFYMSLISRH